MFVPLPTVLAQAAVTAASAFYLTLLLIFLTAIVTTVLTKWARDKCLKYFHHYHVTLERSRGQTIWGRLRVFSSGIEVVYDHPFVDSRGRKKTSYLMYAPDVDAGLLSLFRYADELPEDQRRRRAGQIRGTFNPGPVRRLWRGVRNFVNTLRDAFNAAIGAVVNQYQKVNPAAGTILSGQTGSVTQIGQTLLGKLANAYEPLLEQYIGQPVILDVADPLDPNNAASEYTGYLADYTQNFIAVFNVEHRCAEPLVLTLPDVERGDPLPPLSPPPPPGAPVPPPPDPLKVEHQLAVRIDGQRFKVTNLRHDPVVLRRLERDGFEPLTFGMVIPPNATLDLPARDARGARLHLDVVRCIDVVAPRRFATIRHAGELVERRGLVDELHLDQLPLVPTFLRPARPNGQRTEEPETSDSES